MPYPQQRYGGRSVFGLSSSRGRGGFGVSSGRGRGGGAGLGRGSGAIGDQGQQHLQQPSNNGNGGESRSNGSENGNGRGRRDTSLHDFPFNRSRGPSSDKFYDGPIGQGLKDGGFGLSGMPPTAPNVAPAAGQISGGAAPVLPPANILGVDPIPAPLNQGPNVALSPEMAMMFNEMCRHLGTAILETGQKAMEDLNCRQQQ